MQIPKFPLSFSFYCLNYSFTKIVTECFFNSSTPSTFTNCTLSFNKQKSFFPIYCFLYSLVNYFLNGSNSLLWYSSGLSFGQRDPLQGSSCIPVMCYHFFFFSTSFSGLTRCSTLIWAYPQPQPWNQPWLLLEGVVLETKIWFSHNICDSLWFFSLKFYFGQTNEFHYRVRKTLLKG